LPVSFIEKDTTLQQSLVAALVKGIAKPKILILPDGCVTVPDQTEETIC
jgi:hypothetical protein